MSNLYSIKKRKNVNNFRYHPDNGHPYDLNKLPKELGQDEYDKEFWERFMEAIETSYDKGKTILEVINEFLEHHYKGATDKERFLTYVPSMLKDRHPLGFPGDDMKDNMKEMNKWFDKRKTPVTINTQNTITKIHWKGKQKELAELFLTLEQKGWIEQIQDGERSSICRNILIFLTM